jgi:predicted P-loop ATPase
MTTTATSPAKSFFETLYSGVETGFLTLFTLPGEVSHFVPVNGNGWADDAARLAAAEREYRDVYFGIGIQAEPPQEGRGTEAGVIAIPGLWGDVDVLGPNHKSKNLPPTFDDAKKIVEAAVFAPTMVVQSGGGLQPYWLFREPFIIESDTDRQRIKTLSVRFQQSLGSAARSYGWSMDQTPDLCRVLRVPGTFNRKHDPVLIEFRMVGNGIRYNPSEFEEMLAIEQNPIVRKHTTGPAPKHPRANLEGILAGCGWMRHCRDDAALLKEPAWYRMLAVLSRCIEGHAAAHEFSRPYPGYTAAETDRKLDQAAGRAGPPTCDYIEHQLNGARFCQNCQHRGKIRSPIVLGLPARKAQRIEPGVEARSGLAGGDGRQTETSTNLDWLGLLLVNKDGNPRSCYANATIALANASEWTDVLAFNEFSNTIVALKPAPGQQFRLDPTWTDLDDSNTLAWLNRQGINISVELVSRAVQNAGEKRRFHPIRDYLNGLEWDEKQRIDNWLTTYLRVSPTGYAGAVGRRFLISAVARVFQPGCKADCCLILEGPQGRRKSSALRILAVRDEWFTDDIADLGSKDAALQTAGVWIIEMGELDSIGRSDVSKIKAFISRQTDRFRPPYGRRVITYKRQCVFAGSVNHGSYLRDETGARRFWPAQCGAVDLDKLIRDRDQLWAEAVNEYRSGASWWLETAELEQAAEHEQSDRYEGDPWDELVLSWIRDPTERRDQEGHPLEPFMTSTSESVTVTDILLHCLNKRPEYWQQPDKNRVARILRANGWVRNREKASVDPDRPWKYFPSKKKVP